MSTRYWTLVEKSHHPYSPDLGPFISKFTKLAKVSVMTKISFAEKDQKRIVKKRAKGNWTKWKVYS